MKTYDELVARAAAVGISLQNFDNYFVGGPTAAEARAFLLGVSAAIDAVEAMQAERREAGEMPKMAGCVFTREPGSYTYYAPKGGAA